jgi:hypothetical protein
MEQKNQVAKIECKPLKIGERIKQEIVEGLPIRGLENSEPLNQAFRRVFVLIGLRLEQYPTKEETQILVDFCRRKFGNYTAIEIVIAFEMAIAGDFKADTEHFGQFTPKYLSSILNAYTGYRSRVALQVQEEQSKKRKEQGEAEVQEAVDRFYGEAVDMYQNSGKTFEGSKYHANVLYETLKQHYTREELIEFKNQAKEKLEREKAEAMKEQNPIKRFQKDLSYSPGEWKRQTAVITVNNSLNRKIEI